MIVYMVMAYNMTDFASGLDSVVFSGPYLEEARKVYELYKRKKDLVDLYEVHGNGVIISMERSTDVL